MSAPPKESADASRLTGRRVAVVGRLAGMGKRLAQQRVAEAGGQWVERPESGAELIVVGEQAAGAEPASPATWVAALPPDAELRVAIQAGRVEVIGESQLWERLGLLAGDLDVRRLYTAALLADVVGQPLTLVRRWQRLGLLVPVQVVQRLAYFDFGEVTVARRLGQLAAAGVSPEAIARRLELLGRLLPGVQRPLADPAVVIEGRELLVRQGEGLVGPGGQLRFDFDAEPPEPVAERGRTGVLALHPPDGEGEPAPTVEELVSLAGECDEHGRLALAAEAYRSALAAGGPSAEICFLLAEVLFRLGDRAAARERYFMAIELEPGFVEARANLGCLLADEGELELAVAAFEGALAQHADYPDAHYHLARTLDESGRTREAEAHWRAFCDLAPQSPWAAEARERLGEPGRECQPTDDREGLPNG